MRPGALLATTAAVLALGLSGCGTTRQLLHRHGDPASRVVIAGSAADAGTRLGSPAEATRNTSRVDGADPVADAALTALAVYPSASPRSHPRAVTLAATGSWEGALAASVLMAPPLQAPVLLSGSGSLPAASASALSTLAPTGAGDAGGAQVIRIGEVPKPGSERTVDVRGRSPFALAAAIARFQAAAAGTASPDVVIASTASPAYAMPAAGWAAESGDPILFVTRSAVPQATRQALLAQGHPHIYVLGPAGVVDDRVLRVLRRFGTVRRVGARGAAANSVAFAVYRDPHCPTDDEPCAPIPGSFGWAMRSPGHGYTLLNASRPLDAAASAALSGSGDYGPQLIVQSGSGLPRSVMNFFLDYATPGYNQEGPTAAVYNHGWVIGDPSAISIPVQAELDTLLQAVPQTPK